MFYSWEMHFTWTILADYDLIREAWMEQISSRLRKHIQYNMTVYVRTDLWSIYEKFCPCS